MKFMFKRHYNIFTTSFMCIIINIIIIRLNSAIAFFIIFLLAKILRSQLGIQLSEPPFGDPVFSSALSQ